MGYTSKTKHKRYTFSKVFISLRLKNKKKQQNENSRDYNVTQQPIAITYIFTMTQKRSTGRGLNPQPALPSQVLNEPRTLYQAHYITHTISLYTKVRGREKGSLVGETKAFLIPDRLSLSLSGSRNRSRWRRVLLWSRSGV
jgi:hypothetical protein